MPVANAATVATLATSAQRANLVGNFASGISWMMRSKRGESERLCHCVAEGLAAQIATDVVGARRGICEHRVDGCFDCRQAASSSTIRAEIDLPVMTNAATAMGSLNRRGPALPGFT